MFKNLKDLIKTRQKLEDAKNELKLAQANQSVYNDILEKYNLELDRREAQLAKIETIIANRKETLKGLNEKLIKQVKPITKKAAPKKAVKKTK